MIVSKKLFITMAFLVLCIGVFYYQEINNIRAIKANAWTVDHKADCAVVLTGGPGRVTEGFDLLVRKDVKKLIISGVYPGARLREIFPQWPFYGLASVENVILEKHSETTYGNARQSLALVEALRCRDIVLVTSMVHMYRAQKIFIAIYPTDFPIYPRAIVAGRANPGLVELLVEATKSIFYSIWAY